MKCYSQGSGTLQSGKFVCMMQGGDLRKALFKDGTEERHVFDWENRGKHVALAIARGLHFLHQNDVIHRFGSVEKDATHDPVYPLTLTMIVTLNASSTPSCQPPGMIWQSHDLLRC